MRTFEKHLRTSKHLFFNIFGYGWNNNILLLTFMKTKILCLLSLDAMLYSCGKEIVEENINNEVQRSQKSTATIYAGTVRQTIQHICM